MKPVTLFITYNPKDETGRTLAIRLHTIGAVNGFRMYLPERDENYPNDPASYETLRRINLSDYMVLFSTTVLSKQVIEEIVTASEHFHDPSRIIVVYDSKVGKNIKGGESEYFEATYFDPETDDQGAKLHEIVNRIFRAETRRAEESLMEARRIADAERRKKENSQAMNALLGVGLGLFALAALSSDNEAPAKSKRR
jgi:hypothetical protein